MSITPPENYTYGTVVGRFLSSIADGADADRYPDVIPATGRVVFTPNATYYKNTAWPATFINTPVEGTLDAAGFLVDNRGAPGVVLMATDHPDISPSGWTYKVTMTINGRQFTPFDIKVEGGQTIDLTTVMPASTSAGAITIVSEASRIAAEAAAAEAVEAAALAHEVVNDGVLAVAVVAPDPDTVPKRTTSGALAVGAPTLPEHATTLASVRATRTGKTTATPGRSSEVLAPEFVATGGDLLTHAALGMPSIATMRVMCTDGIVTAPLGRFYAYISTDHDTAGTPEPWNGKGGVVLAYADSPTGPWTAYRNSGGQLVVWQDTVVGNQTETPTPLYVPEDPTGKPIYIYYQNQGAGLNQSTLLARSASGRPEDFERVGIVVQGRGTTNPVWPGDGQSTYLEPMRYDGQIIAVHLMGGGDWAQYGRSYSQDGRRFVTDPRRYGHFSHLVGADNGRRVSIRSLFRWRGQPWAVVTIGNHTSGFVTAPRQVGLVRLSTDLRRVVGRVHTLADPAIGAGVVLEHEGRLYMYYRSGDAYSAFRVAVAEG